MQQRRDAPAALNAGSRFSCFGSRCHAEPLPKVFWVSWWIVGLAVLLLLGCRRQAESDPVVVMTYQITPQPVRVGVEDISLLLKDANSKPINGTQIELEADMSHPGMAPMFVESVEIGEGRYQGKINLTMPGDWVVLVHMTLPNQLKVEREIQLKGVETK